MFYRARAPVVGRAPVNCTAQLVSAAGRGHSTEQPELARTCAGPKARGPAPRTRARPF